MASLIGWVKQKAQNVEHDIANVIHPPTPPQPAPRPALPQQGQPGFGVVRPNAPVVQQPTRQQVQQQQHPSLIHRIGTSIDQVGKQTGLGIERAGVGLVQSGSGLYDLAGQHMFHNAPSGATSRFDKTLNNAGQSLDQRSRNIGGPTQAAYKISQVSSNLASFMAPTRIAGAATQLPKVANVIDHAAPVINVAKAVTKPLNTGVTKVAANIATHGPVGRIAGAGIKGGLSGTNLINSAAGTALTTGQMASHGQKVTGKDVASNAALNLAMGAGLSASPQATKEVIGGAKIANKTLRTAQSKATTNLSIDAGINQISKQQRAIQKRIDNAPLNATRGTESLQQHIQVLEGQKAQLNANRPQMSRTEKVLAIQPGGSMKPVRPAEVTDMPNNTTASSAKPAPVQPKPAAKPQLPASRETGGESLPNNTLKTGIVDKHLQELQAAHKEIVAAEAAHIASQQPAKSDLYNKVLQHGGISSSAYESLPKYVKRTGGMSADKMAQELGYPSEDHLMQDLQAHTDVNNSRLTPTQIREQAITNLESGKSQFNNEYSDIKNRIAQRQGELSLYPKGTRSQVKVTDKPTKMSDAELQSLSQTPEAMQRPSGNAVVHIDQKKVIRNPDAERQALETLQKGGTNDTAVYGYMKATGADLQNATNDVARVAQEAGLTVNGKKNPLIGSVKVPNVSEGDFAQANHNAKFVQAHEQRVGKQATDSYNQLSTNDKVLLKEIETKPVEEVAKGAENPAAFTKAAKDIRTYYDTRHAYDNYLGMDVGYRANYLRHIFDKAEQQSPETQIRIKNGNKNVGYTKARTKDSIASEVGATLQRDIKGSSFNHAKLTYEKGLNQAFPDKIANGQAVATAADGQYDQIQHPFGKALFAPKDIAHGINTRTWAPADSKALATYDKINHGLKYAKLAGGFFHAFTESGNFVGQQLASGKLFTNPSATGKLAKVFFSQKAMTSEITRLEANGVADKARLSGLTTTAKEVLGDVNVNLRAKAVDKITKYTGLQAMHDATFQREIPYAKLKIFEQKTEGLDPHKPADLAKMRQIARETNQIFGGIDRMTSGIKPNTFRWLQRALLATDFTEGKLHTLSDALTSKGPAGNLARQTVAGKALLFGVLATAGGVAGGEYKNKTPQAAAKDAAGNLLDPSFTIGGYTAKFPKTHISEAIDALKPYSRNKNAPWNASGLQHYAASRLAALPSEASQLLTNKDYYGQPIYGNNTKKNGGGPISPAKVGLNAVNTVAPIPFGQGVNTAQGKQNIGAMLGNIAGLNVRPTPTNKASTGNTPVDQLKAAEAQQNTDLKNSLSAEDYKLSTLSKADRQKLIDQGKYTQAKFDGLDNYVTNKKKQLGMDVPAPKTSLSPEQQVAKSEADYAKDTTTKNARDTMMKKLPQGMNGNDVATLQRFTGLPDAKKQDIFNKEPDAQYKLKLAEFERDKHLGTISSTDLQTKQNDVFKAEVGAQFPKEVRDVYGMTQAKATAYLANNPNGNNLANAVIQYGDSLAQNGIENNKFVDSKGNVGIVPKGTTIEAKSGRISATAQKNGIPDNIFAALVKQESGGNQGAKSPVGAIGLTQLMPATAKALGVDPNNADQNLDGGARYLKQMYDKFGRWDYALAAYNAGPGAVEKYHGIPPFTETQNYVKSILGMVNGGIKGDSLNLVLSDPNAQSGGALNQSGVNTTAASTSNSKSASLMAIYNAAKAGQGTNSLTKVKTTVAPSTKASTGTTAYKRPALKKYNVTKAKVNLNKLAKLA